MRNIVNGIVADANSNCIFDLREHGQAGRRVDPTIDYQPGVWSPQRLPHILRRWCNASADAAAFHQTTRRTDPVNPHSTGCTHMDVCMLSTRQRAIYLRNSTRPRSPTVVRCSPLPWRHIDRQHFSSGTHPDQTQTVPVQTGPLLKGISHTPSLEDHQCVQQCVHKHGHQEEDNHSNQATKHQEDSGQATKQEANRTRTERFFFYSLKRGTLPSVS